MAVKNWSFSPNSGNGNNVWNGYPDGHFNNNNANNSNGAAPDCENGEHKVAKAKSEHSHKEPSSGFNSEIVNTDGTTFRGVVPISGVLEDVASFKNLYASIWKCKRNVLWKGSTAGFVKNGLENSYNLRQELLSGKYRISSYTCFIVHEKKDRNIVATKIRDRTVQKSLAEHYVYEELSKHFIRDNKACLNGGGTDDARKRLKCFLHRFYRKHKLDGYVLKIDIKDYFGSTPHNVVKTIYEAYLDDEWAKAQMNMIVDSFNGKIVGKPDGIGLGLGSQMTQLTELAVLNKIDHYIKERLKIKYYLRYMDDMILIHESKDHLKKCLNDIEQMMNEIGLEINHKKTFIQPIKQGIHFLGFSFRLAETGKVIMTIQHKKVSKYRRKLKKLVGRYKDGIMTEKQVTECYKSWKAHASKGDNYFVIKRMDQYFKDLMEVKNVS